MSRALLFTLLCCACTPAPRASAQFEFTLAHLGAGPVMGVSGPYDAVFSPGWARVSPDAPLFVPGAPADTRLEGLAERGDALGYVGSAGAIFPEGNEANYETVQLKPGEVFSTHFEAEEGDQLSFGCMFVPSNDTIAGAPAFALFDEKGTPLEGNVTSRAGFYDVGTEESEEPGFGPNQPQRGSGGVVEQQPVTRIDGTDARGNVYPDFASLLRVEITVVSQQ